MDRSAWVKVVLGRAARARSSMAGEESIPEMVAPGKRAARREVLLPGPQPRSMMVVGLKEGPRKVMRSLMGRLRASPKRRYWSGDQSVDEGGGCVVVDMADVKWAARLMREVLCCV